MLVKGFHSLVHYFFYTRNHAMQIVFGTLVLLGHVVLIIDMLPVLCLFEPDGNHIFLPITLLFTNFAFYQLSCLSNPGQITKRSVDFFVSIFKTDGVMYKEGAECRTCHFKKPARSKHCSFCNRCVHRFDHHCVWTNNCVGAYNLRHFLLFLLSLVAMCGNGVLVCAHCLLLLVDNLQLMDTSYIDPETGNILPITYLVLMKYLFLRYPRIVVLWASLLVLLILLIPFVVYHLYLVAINQTTNERFKLAALQDVQRDSSNSDSRTLQSLPSNLSQFYNRGLVMNFMEVLFPCRPHISKKDAVSIDIQRDIEFDKRK